MCVVNGTLSQLLTACVVYTSELLLFNDSECGCWMMMTERWCTDGRPTTYATVYHAFDDLFGIRANSRSPYYGLASNSAHVRNV